MVKSQRRYLLLSSMPNESIPLASEEPKRDLYFTEMATRVSSIYKNIASRQPLVDSARNVFCSFSQFSDDPDCDIVNYHVDCETAVYNLRSSKRPSYRNVSYPETRSLLYLCHGKNRTLLTTCSFVLARSRLLKFLENCPPAAH